ncbi:hypothetical protein GCM10007198_07440 [Microbacterium aerolatum]|uniref:Uncharacterized protein n=1 Tax=Microbacterium aerolatum TaxID=153731 RepID=A0A511AIX0_9MICO|nr:hypothetical protein MAE01_10730 [Microbacterium aerolatum]GGB19358.1 hypothetical protein GCM10007198_07440 [Microbacterium aerolatum]
MPALGVHAAKGFRIHITDRTDNDFRLGIGAHAATLRAPRENGKSRDAAVTFLQSSPRIVRR